MSTIDVGHELTGVVHVTRHGPSLRYLVGKRLLDLTLGTLAIVLTAPLMLVIAVIVAIDGGLPVLYVQERVGARPRRRGDRWFWELRTFRLIKFRTMERGAERSDLHRRFVEAFVAGQLEDETGGKLPYKLPDDPRITRVGRWLRSTSLDELPQLLNVLTGTMSLVGPRPVPTYEVAAYHPDHRARLAGRPGLTGIWQVEGRAVATLEEMVRMDVEYLHAQSLWLDLRLLVRTVPCILLRRGAR